MDCNVLLNDPRVSMQRRQSPIHNGTIAIFYLINILYFNSVAFWFITFTKFSFYIFKSVRRPKSVKGKRRNICSLGQIVIKSKRSEGLKPRDYRLPSFKSVYYF